MVRITSGKVVAMFVFSVLAMGTLAGFDTRANGGGITLTKSQCQFQVCKLLPGQVLGNCNCSYTDSMKTVSWCFDTPDKTCNIINTDVIDGQVFCDGKCVGNPPSTCSRGRFECVGAVVMPEG